MIVFTFLQYTEQPPPLCPLAAQGAPSSGWCTLKPPNTPTTIIIIVANRKVEIIRPTIISLLGIFNWFGRCRNHCWFFIVIGWWLVMMIFLAVTLLMVVGFYCIKSIISTETSKIKRTGTKTNNVLIQRPLDLIIAINLVKLKLFVDNVALLFCFVLYAKKSDCLSGEGAAGRWSSPGESVMSFLCQDSANALWRFHIAANFHHRWVLSVFWRLRSSCKCCRLNLITILNRVYAIGQFKSS